MPISSFTTRHGILKPVLVSANIRQNGTESFWISAMRMADQCPGLTEEDTDIIIGTKFGYALVRFNQPAVRGIHRDKSPRQELRMAHCSWC